ncbi:MAG: DUF1573 domain-containing protein [Candidatus Aminicenantaceae bacterium]
MQREQYGIYRLGVALLMGAVVMVLSLSPLLAQQNPAIKFKEKKWDFGKAQQGKVLTHVFSFQNTGNATLSIANVRTSCGCAAALISNREIQPGKSGEIKVTFNTKGYEGNQTKYIYVDSNDPKEPKAELTVQVAIDVPPRPRIELDRYSIDLGLILESEGIQTQAKLSNPGERELTVEFSHKDAEFKINDKAVSAPLKIAAGKEVTVTMKIMPRRNAGLVREYVLLRTNDPMRPNLSLYVSGYIVTMEQLQELFDRYKDKLKVKKQDTREL